MHKDKSAVLSPDLHCFSCKVRQNRNRTIKGIVMTSDRARTRHTAVALVAWKRLPLSPLL